MWAPQPKYWLWMMSGATIRSISSRLLVCSQVGSRPSVSPLCGSVSKSGIGMKGAVAGLSQRASPAGGGAAGAARAAALAGARSEEHTAELQSQSKLVCRLLLEKKK